MGCCCITRLEQIDDVDQRLSDSKVLLNRKQQAVTLKQQGNQHFKKRSYQNAIKCYSQAIIRNPNQIVYYTNLAQAYRANGQFELSIQTVNKMLRQAFPASVNYSDLLNKGKIIKYRCFASIVKKYIISNTYNREQSAKMKEMIQESIKRFSEIKSGTKIEVNDYLNNALKIKSYLDKIQSKTSEIQVVDYLKKKINQSKNGLHNQKNWSKISAYFNDQNDLLKQIEDYYSKCQQKFIQQAEDDEDYLMDPITYQKLVHPVIVPSGITYQQETLKQYFKKVEYKDPITKQKFQVGEKVVVRNYNIEKYISEMGKIHEIKKQDIQLMVC